MCSSDNLKFCTCHSGPVDKTKPYWTLYSSNTGNDRLDRVVGMINLPFVNETFNYIDFSKNIIDKLNDNSLFDFDYKASDGDIISIHLPNYIDLRIDREINMVVRFEYSEWEDLKYSHQGLRDFYIKKIKSGPISIT